MRLELHPKAAALADNLREANPYLALEPHVVRVAEDNLAPLLAEATLVCEAFDQAEAKAMLVNAVLERFPEKFLVAASGMAGLGSANAISTRRVSRRFYLCGDGVSDVAWWPPGWQCAQGTRPTWSCAF